MNRMTMIEKGCERGQQQQSGQSKNCYSTPSSTSTNSSPGMDRRRILSSSSPRRPSILSNLREFLHPRTASLGEKMFRRSDTMRRVQIRDCNLEHVYDLRDDEESIYDDDSSFRRPRANSSDFLILRKTSRPLSVTVVGLIDQQNDPYHQYMKVVDNYELCPTNSKIHVIDNSMSARKAFGIIRQNEISSLLVWNSETEELYSILTLTDFLNVMKGEKTIVHDELLVKDILSGNRLVGVDASSKIWETCEELHQNKLHRLTVRDELGNVIFLVTLRRVLAAIHKQNRSLHFAQWLNRPIALSNIGTWERIYTIPKKFSVKCAAEEMLGFRLSTIPIVDDDQNVVAVITKKDICNALPLNSPSPREWMRRTKLSSILGNCKREIFIESKDTIGSVLDRLLNGSCHTAFVLHQKKVIGAVSLSDILGFLLGSQLSQSELPNTPSSSGSSSDNFRTFTK